VAAAFTAVVVASKVALVASTAAAVVGIVK
jgi:hypothetical protein